MQKLPFNSFEGKNYDAICGRLKEGYFGPPISEQ